MSKKKAGMLLNKDQEVDLNELDPGLHKVVVGLGWDAPEKDHGADVDLDASVFLLDRGEKVLKDADFVFYNNPELTGGAVKHMGDNKTGFGDGDDEKIAIHLDEVPFDVEKIVVAVSIHNADERQQDFGLVKNAFVRILDAETEEELVRYDLTEKAAGSTAFILATLTRTGSHWSCKAAPKGVTGGLYQIANDFGVNVAQP